MILTVSGIVKNEKEHTGQCMASNPAPYSRLDFAAAPPRPINCNPLALQKIR